MKTKLYNISMKDLKIGDLINITTTDTDHIFEVVEDPTVTTGVGNIPIACDERGDFNLEDVCDLYNSDTYKNAGVTIQNGVVSAGHYATVSVSVNGKAVTPTSPRVDTCLDTKAAFIADTQNLTFSTVSDILNRKLGRRVHVLNNTLTEVNGGTTVLYIETPNQKVY